MPIQLSEHFTYGKLLRFTFPSIVMMIFISVYSVVDGFFVAKFVGATPFAAVNIVWPFIMILGSIGFMLGSGGSALVAKTLGERKTQKANQIFSLLIYTIITCSFLFAVLGLLFIQKILIWLGVTGILLKNCLIYAKVLMPAVPALMLQVIFHTFMVTAERPKFGMVITILAGIVNFILDAVFILAFDYGLKGAALATVISQIIGGGIPLIYFMFPNKSLLRLGYTKIYVSALLKSCGNGISEFLSNISMSIVGMLYNYQLLRIAGENGVVAYGVISYVNFIFLASFIGYSVGSNPIISYHYGAKNKTELHNLLHKSLRLISIVAVIMTASAICSALPIARLFIGYNSQLMQITAHGFQIYALSFLLAGFNIYASAFFTALNNGLVSAFISVFRTMISECLCVIILPLFFGVEGIWAAIIVAEIMALVVSVVCIISFKPKYGY